MKDSATISRRHFLAVSSAVAASLCNTRLVAETPEEEWGMEAQSGFFPHHPKPHPAPASNFVYFGTDTDKPGAHGIYVSRFDPASGSLSTPTLAAQSFRPAFFAVGLIVPPGGTPATARRTLYVCNEGDDHSSAISFFAIDPATGALRPMGKVSAGGKGPCYLSLDMDGRTAYAADYSGSAIATYRVQPDGTLSQPVEHLDFRQERFGHHGPRADRQDASHPHSALLSPDNRFLLINDLGNDSIVTFPVDAETAKLGPPHRNERREGSGPRHLAFHPNGRWVYCVNELDNTVDQLLWTPTRGDLAHGVQPQALLTGTGHPVSTVDAGFHGENTAAEIVIEGDFLYVSNRGENSIAVFSIEQGTGMLTLFQRIACGGKAPRQFTFDPSGHWLLCGNQNSDSVTVFARNPADGRLSGPVQTLAMPSPMMTLCI